MAVWVAPDTIICPMFVFIFERSSFKSSDSTFFAMIFLAYSICSLVIPRIFRTVSIAWERRRKPSTSSINTASVFKDSKNFLFLTIEADVVTIISAFSISLCFGFGARE